MAVSLAAVVGGIIYTMLFHKKNRRDAPPLPKPAAAANTGSQVVLVLGAGTIGSAFATVFLSRGMTVHVCDPFVKEDVLQKRIQDKWSAVVARGIAQTPQPCLERLTTSQLSPAQALVRLEQQGQTVDFVQECTWEDVDNKQTVLAELDRSLPSDVLIASSTSFIPWDLLTAFCTHKHRIFIGHPAIPHTHSYMEIYGTDPEWTAVCQKWYHNASFDVIVMKATIPGHVLNSFFKVNMDHGQNLIRQGVCSPQDVNKALRHIGRDFYGRHMFLSGLIRVGGDRGMDGGMELVERIRKDAVFLTLFSKFKRVMPDFVARFFGKTMGHCIVNLLMLTDPKEYMEAVKEAEAIYTQDGTIPLQVALHESGKQMYEIIPLEVDNDPINVYAALEEKRRLKSA